MVPYHAKLNLKGFSGVFLRTSNILRQTSGTTYSISDPYENALFVNEKVKPKKYKNGLTSTSTIHFREKNGDAQNIFPALVELLVCMIKLFKNKESLKNCTHQPFQNYVL